MSTAIVRLAWVCASVGLLGGGCTSGIAYKGPADPATSRAAEPFGVSHPAPARLAEVFGWDGPPAMRRAVAVELSVDADRRAQSDRVAELGADGAFAVRRRLDDPRAVARLADLLLSPGSYRDVAERHFTPSPTIAIRFINAAGVGPTILFDPEDDLVAAIPAGPAAEGVVWGGPGLVVSPGRAELVAMLQSIWPGQVGIRELRGESGRVRRALSPAVYDVVATADRVECRRLLASARWRWITYLAYNSNYYARGAVAWAIPVLPRPDLSELRRPPNRIPGVEMIGGFAVEKLGPSPDRMLAAALGAAVVDDGSYPRGKQAVAGCFEPGVAYRFCKGGRTVDLLICFHCGNLSWHAEGFPTGEVAADWGGFSGFSSEGWRRMAELTRRAFPDDADLKAIPEHEPW